MKHKKSVLWGVAAAIAAICIFLAICFFMNRKNNKDDEPLEITTPKIEELTAAQIDEVNKAFDPVILDEDGNIKAANPINSFFTSYYDTPEDIDIHDFLQYFPKDGDVTDEAEFNALKNSDNCFLDAKDTLGSVPFPIHKYSSETVDKALRKYAGITTGELKGVGMDEVCYLAETDTYYTFTSDFAPGIFSCTRGETEGDTVRLYSESESEGLSMLTLKKTDGRYLIVSHKLIEAP